MSLFSALEMAPADPIMGLTEQFNADTNPNRVNLGVGIYQDENGELPLLNCVVEAEKLISFTKTARGYQPIPGNPTYNQQTQNLVFGENCEAVTSRRIVTTQSLGGTGGLRVGAGFLKKFFPQSKILISDPSWENHRALFTATGFEVGSYRYYDSTTRGLDFPGMLDDLTAADAGTIVLLHACCHNPTGYDLSEDQWDEVLKVVIERGLIPFIDFAYQGFGEGLAEDARAVRKFVDSGLNLVCATSYSKSMALYGERVGSLSVVCEDAPAASRVLSQVKPVIRTLYSNPPTHGGKIVATILSNPVLRSVWTDELQAMRQRICDMRVRLVEALKAAGVDRDMSFIAKQRGMFSFLGLSKEQMVRLRNEYAVYGTDKGRICVAALNSRNLGYVAESIAAVLK